MKFIQKYMLLFFVITAIPFHCKADFPTPIEPSYEQKTPTGSSMPPVTEEELLQWQQEVDKEINAFVSTLPATRAEAEALSAQTGEKIISQEEFHQEVAIMEEKMKNMSEEELVQFLGTVFPQDQAMPEQMPQAPTVPVYEEKTPTEPTVKEEKPKPENTEKVTKVLNNIITRTERFMRRTQQMPDLAANIQKWVKQDKVKEWQNGLTWNKLKADIESFIAFLHHIKDSIDPKTKQPRYLSTIMKDEALLNNLTKVSVNLTTYEPKVSASEFGSSKENKAALEAVKDVLGALNEALYTLDIPQEFKKLVEKYEPQAKILRDEYDANVKRSHEESKRVPVQAPARNATSIGYGASPSVTNAGGNEYFHGYAGPSAGYAPSYGNPYQDYGSYEQPSMQQQQQPGGQPQGGGKMATSGRGKNEKATPVAEAKEAPGKKPEAPKQPEAPVAENPKLTELVNKFAKNIESAMNSVEEREDIFGKLVEHVASPTTKVSPGFVQTIISPKGFIKSLKKATDALTTLKLNPTIRADKKVKALYAGKIKPIIKDTSKVFDGIAKQIEGLINNGIDKLPVTKQYAYFGNEKVKEQAIKTEPALANLEYTANLTDVLKALDAYKDAISGL